MKSAAGMKLEVILLSERIQMVSDKHYDFTNVVNSEKQMDEINKVNISFQVMRTIGSYQKKRGRW